MNIDGIVYESLVDGIGVRATLFFCGCKHICKGCHNSELQNFKYGKPFTYELQLEIIKNIKENPLINGVTFSGGDPFYSAYEVMEFVKKLKQEIQDINIWSYSGFTFDEIINSNDLYMIELLKNSDVLVDGEFIETQRDLTLPFRGSKNQRIINVKESIKQNKIIEFII
jgi:anaerobic ribonucleoside-triphosphate reductase activating protein